MFNREEALKNIASEKIERLAGQFSKLDWKNEKDNDIDFLLNAIFFEYIIDRNEEKIEKVVDFLRDEGNIYGEIWSEMIVKDGVRQYYVGYMYNAFKNFLENLSAFWYYIGDMKRSIEANHLAADYFEEYLDILDGGISDPEGNKIKSAYKLGEGILPDRLPEWNFKKELEKYLAGEPQAHK